MDFRKSSWLLGLLWTGLFFLSLPVEALAENKDNPCTFPQTIVDLPPNPKGTPTEVKTGVYLNDLSDVDDVKESFTADFFLRLTWKDERIGKLLKARGVKTCVIPIEKAWRPAILILNEQELTKIYRDWIFLDQEGNAIYTQRYYGDLSANLTLKDFPLDHHELKIQLFSYFPIQDTILDEDKKFSGMEEDLSMNNWHLGSSAYQVATRTSKWDRQKHAQMQFTVQVKRRFGFFLWKVILPMTMIVMMSWMVFWIPPEYRVSQLALAATSFLTLVAFQLALVSMLPKIPYLTRLDYFIMGSTFLVFMALLETVSTTYLVYKESTQRATRLDRWSRVVFPLGFIMIISGSFFI